MTGNSSKLSDQMTKNTPDLLINQAHRALIQQLREGQLPSGMFLSIPMLVERLELPIAAVRDAVKRAEASGLITVLPKRGITIMDANAKTTQECLELRALFDCEGARQIIEQGMDIPLADLKEQHERLRDDARNKITPDLPSRAIKTDLSLHDVLSTGLASDLAAGLYADNRDRIAIIQNTRRFVPNRVESAMEEHLEIIAAIEAGQVQQAQSAIRTHLHNTLQWWGIFS